MAIGVFDSGVGGLTIHHTLTRRFPGRDLIYLADQQHAPYGGRTGEEIVDLTRAGCERLFAEGASVVVLACNTASAIALRRLQQTWVPEAVRTFGRPVNVLGIIVPTIEAATGLPWTYARETDDRFRDERKSAVEVLGLFCTQATANSRVYEIEIDKRREDLAVFTEPCPGLAGQIEAGVDEDELRATVRDHVEALRRRIGRWPDKVILGCTHYGIVAHLFAEALPEGTPVIGQPDAVADALDRYFARHPEYVLGDQGRLRFLTTGSPGGQGERIERFWGGPLTFEKA